MPRFPFRRSVGQNLRDLFEHDRLLAQSNQLGYSSLSPGEGMVEVWDASDELVAAVGHDDDGNAGLLVPAPGGGLQTVQEHIAAALAAEAAQLEARIADAEARLDGHASRLGAAENDIADVQAANAAQTTRLDGHAVRLGRHENDMEAIDAKLVNAHNALEQRVAELEEPGKAGNPINPTPITKG